MWKIYCHKNKINNKEYIGITSQKNPNKRWRNGKGYIRSKKFYSAIEKYGWDSFEHIILLENLTLEEAKNKEQQLIRKNKANNISYNITDGGDGNCGWVMSEETKRKIAEKHLGIKLSEEHKNNISISGKGRIVSEETKRKIAEKHKGHKMSEETKRKIAEKHKTFFLNNTHPLLGKIKTNDEKLIDRLAQKNRIVVYKYSLDKILLNQYNSLREIRKIKGLNQIKIKKICENNKGKDFNECEIYKDFIFVYDKFN